MQRREFQRILIDELRSGQPATLDDAFFAAVEAKANEPFPQGKRAEIARKWVDDLVGERILVKTGAGLDEFQLNPNPIVGETATERFENLPADVLDQRMPVSLVALYAINSFLFLLLSFFFLPDSIVKVLGSAAGVALGVFGLKSLNPSESSEAPRLLQRKVIGAALIFATLVQGILLGIGFTYPCQIIALPGSTVFVDGKFLERTSEPPEDEKTTAGKGNSPENIQPWLKARKKIHFLRWEMHEIKITKKWYVDADRSQESVQNVSVDLKKLLKLAPGEAFAKWKMESEQRPHLKIDYGLGRKEDAAAPAPDSTVTGDIRFTETELKELVEVWDQIWTSALDQKDVVGHKRTEPYIAGIQLVQDRSTPYLEFQIRDWTEKPVKALRPIPTTSASIYASSQLSERRAAPTEEELKRLLADSLREEVFKQLLTEIGIPEKIKPPPEVKEIASLAQKLNTEIEISAATPTPAPSPGVGPTPFASPRPSAAPFATPAFAPTPTPTPMASASPNAETTVKELEVVAIKAVNDDRLEVAVSAQQQLMSALTEMEKNNSPSDKSARLKRELEASQRVVENAIRSKTSKGRVYIHVVDELQKESVGKIVETLKAAHFGVIGIQNVGGRAYIPDTAEVRFFSFPEPAATRQAADQIVNILKAAGVQRPRPSYVVPSARERQSSVDITTHFEIWFARDSFSGKTAP
jgi:hypothetical protein